jgi:hypothetical protein
MLPEDGDEDEDGRDEDERERYLRDGSGREGLDVDVGSGALVALLVPAREGGQQDEGEEGEDDGDDEQVGEDDGVLESRRDPHQIERVLVDVQVVDERGGVVGADVAAAVSVDADAEVADAHAELGVADNVCDGLRDTGVDLLRGVGGRVLFVP